MKCPQFVLSILTITSFLAASVSAAVLLDDSWADGTRDDTTLPEESAWFASNAGTTPTLSVSPGTLLGNVLMFATNAGSRLWITHFTPAGSPVTLGIGDTLKVTLVFTPSNLPAVLPTSRGLRLGLFNFSEPGAARVTGDGFSTGAGTGAPGANVTGYLLNMNFAQSLIANPLQIMKRTDTPNINLMGASAVFTSLSSGGGAAGDAGFTNGPQYTLEFSLKRLDTSVQITTRFSDGSGWNISHTASDASNPTFGFDGFALRPNGVADTAESFTFSRFKAELIPYELRIASVRFDLAQGIIVAWDSRPGTSYQLQQRQAFDDNTPWTALATVTATSLSTSLADFDGLFEIQRFYRVVEVPSP
jgi:hypothetical protein